MNAFINDASWIWANSNPMADEYAEFVDHFFYESGTATLQISADSNYAVYINGMLAAWGQYADFPYDKIFDEIDITRFCQEGENRIAILVWYYGIDTTSVYYPGNAGLIYALQCEDKIICQSSEQTLSRMSKAYMSHRMHTLSMQLGFGYGYDATKEDAWIVGELIDFTPSVIVEQNLPLRARPCDKLTLLPNVSGVQCKKISDTDIIFDLSKEQVGFLYFKLSSSCKQEITIAYGEHLADGCVRRIIGDRDFSALYIAKEGNNEFINPFRRFGCRYLEIFSKYPITIEEIGIAPTMYVLPESQRPVLTQKQNMIYDMCIETLHLCMHEHYEDCPWREQALYAMDSRNQMLCGYYAFNEYRFPRANLQLMANDNREDGLLSICYPIKLDLVIPSFSLHYITACKEYLEHSDDKDFLLEIYPKLVSIIETFTKRIANGLIQPFHGPNYWNFYEWKDGLSNEDRTAFHYDSAINCLLSIALQNMAIISNALGIENDYKQQAVALNESIRSAFWDAEKGIIYNQPGDASYSQLGNALAILCGVVEGPDAIDLCKRMSSDQEMTPISLSMVCFKYDAWLKCDKTRFKPVILKDIETIYTPMIEFGSSTVWETELGESDFWNAGSLCHGWSAMPLYYYHTLTEKNITTA